jgi:fructose-bisphosphate aldolase class I
VEKKFKGINL